MTSSKLYTIITGEKDSEGQAIKVEPTQYLLAMKPHEAIDALQSNVQAIAGQLEECSRGDLEAPENIEKVRDLVFELEVAQGYLGEVFKRLAEQKESSVEEGHLMPDHVHMLISIPPKYAVAQVVGYIKGKSAIHIARTYGERKRNFVGEHFWARGYCVSTVGMDEQRIRAYVREQEQLDKHFEQGELDLNQ